MFFMLYVVVFVLYLLGVLSVNFIGVEDLPPVLAAFEPDYLGIHGYAGDSTVHCTWIEVVWTVIPTIILLVIALPSFVLLYSMDEQVDPSLTLKVIGRQWYWSYEFTDTVDLLAESYRYMEGVLLKPEVVFDAYMDQDFDETSLFRLLKVDNDVYLPSHTNLRILVTSTYVIHSWAIPALGVKVDACPGRLNQVSLYIELVGQFFGQCSELCGLNHAFMPISVVSVPDKVFIHWLTTTNGCWKTVFGF